MKNVCIIGGGFSGIMTAIQLIRKSPEVYVTLINTKYPLSQGIAYNTKSTEHLLNVPAGKMSPFADQPGLFTAWLQSDPAFKKYLSESLDDSFVPRCLYGEFIKEFTLPYLDNKNLKVINEKVVSVKSKNEKFFIEMADQSGLESDALVLAMGNFLPAAPKIHDTSALKKENYFGNPWNPAFLNNLKTNEDVLLIGSGLTMIDCMLSLIAIGHEGKIYSVSPRGYLPKPHVKKPVNYPDFYSELKGKDLAEILSVVRKHLKTAEKDGIPWQSVIDRLRPHVKDLWLNFSKKDKQRFISHVRHIWGVARHRLPVDVHYKTIELIEKDQLRVIGGRVEAINFTDQFDVSIKLRKKHYSELIRVSRIVNCTGPQGNYNEINDPLVQSLINNGLISPDELKMGIKAMPEGNVLDSSGKPVKNLYAVGSILRGVLWETTSVPDLKVNAENVAIQIINSIE
ncbi:MAG: beta-lactamase protein [Bacteroidota bacterium]|jgi:uncharacterized NAD(P)/FAD-binding protein YdhS|nr:beta-lactamase protein [Bacteroidota bacterium]